jgi:hypothetical protein
MAAEPGEQIVRLAFDSPQSLDKVLVEVEEPEVSLTQELHLAISCDGATGKVSHHPMLANHCRVCASRITVWSWMSKR